MDLRSGREKGSILTLLAVALFSLLAMAGLAMDFGHVYVGRSSLQNALDAAALSAAKSVNNGKSTEDASADGTATFGEHLMGILADKGATPTFEYSETLLPFVAGAVSPDARYVRAAVANLPIPTTLLQVVPGIGESLVVAGTAVAGPIPVGNADEGETCDLVPLVACADVDADGNYDGDCSDGSCFGYDVVSADTPSDTTITLKTGSGNSNDWEVGAGNFQLAELACGSGGACVREELAGAGTGCIDNSDPNIHTKPGDTVGPSAQGFNTRFGQYQGPVSMDEAPPDVVTTSGPYHNYLAAVESDAWNYVPVEDGGVGVHGRRILAVQIGNCTGTTNGSGTVQRLGIGCFFMTEPASHSGNTQQIVGQFIGECQAEGDVAEDPGAGPSATTYKIVLYKDPDTDES
jgi:hypothetical protein